jgi:hypothetical protein
MRIIVDLDTDGPVTEAAVAGNVRDAIEHWRLNVGLSADDDVGSVRSVSVVLDGLPRKRVRIRCTQKDLNNVAYVHQANGGGWRCQLANGIPASFSYAGVLGDETGVVFRLEDAATAEDALQVMRAAGGRNWTYELV